MIILNSNIPFLPWLIWELSFQKNWYENLRSKIGIFYDNLFPSWILDNLSEKLKYRLHNNVRTDENLASNNIKVFKGSTDWEETFFSFFFLSFVKIYPKIDLSPVSIFPAYYISHLTWSNLYNDDGNSQVKQARKDFTRMKQAGNVWLMELYTTNSPF